MIFSDHNINCRRVVDKLLSKKLSYRENNNRFNNKCGFSYYNSGLATHIRFTINMPATTQTHCYLDVDDIRALIIEMGLISLATR